jgi:hypothetical protein
VPEGDDERGGGVADTFATATDLATYLEQDSVDTASATQALELATGAVQDYCGWRILAETTTATLMPYGSVVTLPSTHVTAITSVTEGGFAVPPSGYWWLPSGLITRYSSIGVMYGYEMAWRFPPVVVTFTHGYAPAAIPQTIKGVTLASAARVYDNPTGLRSESAGDGQEVKSTGSAQSFAAAWLTDLEQEACRGYVADIAAVFA